MLSSRMKTNYDIEVSELINIVFSVVELAYKAELTARDCNHIEFEPNAWANNFI